MSLMKIDYNLDATVLEEPMDVIINVTYFHYQRPNRNCWDSDLDYNGYYEAEFDLLYMDGKPADDLYKMLTKAEIEGIRTEIFETMVGV